MKRRTNFLLFLAACFPGILCSASWLDTSNRWLVRDYVNFVFPVSDQTEIGWSGDYGTGLVGTVSDDWQAATLNRVKFFRNLAGVPDAVSLNSTLSQYAQEAAFMMSVNNAISHFPPTSWAYYTANAALAAQRSNLAGGITGPDAVLGYMADYGVTNSVVGHRRWLIFPQITEIGSGDVPGNPTSSMSAVNVLWIIPSGSPPRPETRDPFVAWPPAGYIPNEMVFARWSFSHPGANFSNAVVTMTMDGQPVPLFQEPWDPANYGEPALVWVPSGLDTNAAANWPTPDADETISVSVANVVVNGNNASPQTFLYDVIIFDPNKAGPEETPTSVQLDEPVLPNQSTQISLNSLRQHPWGETLYQVRSFQPEDPPGDPGDYLLTGNTSAELVNAAHLPTGYDNAVQSDRVSSGSHAFHLSNPVRSDVSITLKEEFLLEENTLLAFQSSLAWSSEAQTAVVEINLGDGEHWQTIWQKSGPVEHNTSFEPVQIDLSHLADQTCRFRFSYRVSRSGPAYLGSDSSLGWVFDTIQVKNTRLITDKVLHPAAPNPTFTATFNRTQPFVVQGREVAFDGVPLDWGRTLSVVPLQPDGLLTTQGQWVQDPIIGWNFAANANWTNVLNWKWVYYPDFPWLYSSAGWFYYLSGSVQDGIWLYHPSLGYAYTRVEYGGWFLHQPFDSSSWKQFNP